MTLPLKLVLRFFGAHPWQAALCIVGVALGIAVVLAIDVANQSARNAFQLASDTVSGGATHSIMGDATGIDEDFYTELRVSRGLRNIHPVVTGYVELMGQRYRVLGIDPLAGSAGQGHAGFGGEGAGMLIAS